MILKIYSVFDKAVEGFMQPFFAQSHGAAIRSFTDAINDAQHQFSKHGPDYSLYFLGEWCDENGEFTPCAPEKILTGFDAKIKT